MTLVVGKQHYLTLIVMRGERLFCTALHPIRLPEVRVIRVSVASHVGVGCPVFS